MTSSYFSDLFDYDAAVNRQVLELLLDTRYILHKITLCPRKQSAT